MRGLDRLLVRAKGAHAVELGVVKEPEASEAPIAADGTAVAPRKPPQKLVLARSCLGPTSLLDILLGSGWPRAPRRVASRRGTGDHDGGSLRAVGLEVVEHRLDLGPYSRHEWAHSGTEGSPWR